MNPVLICLLLTAQMMVMGKPISESKERPAAAIHKDDSFGSQLRHRSLPQSSLTAAGNFAGIHGKLKIINNQPIFTYTQIGLTFINRVSIPFRFCGY